MPAFTPGFHGLAAPTLDDAHLLYDEDYASQASSAPHQPNFRADAVAKMQAECGMLDMRRVPRMQLLYFSPYTNRTAATQLLSTREALSDMLAVADPTGTMTMDDSLTWVSGWHALLFNLTKVSIHANREDTYDLHRLVDDLFSQLQERLNSGANEPAAFKILLADITEYFE